MKIAFVHDWLETYAGAERVLEQMLSCYPDADLFALVDFLPQDGRDFVLGKTCTGTTFIQRLLYSRRYFRKLLPLFPIAIQQLDLSSYDIVISSSHCVAKGVITSPDQLHLCMTYSPVRYAWDLQSQYLSESNLEKGLKSIIARWFLHRLRQWDAIASNGVDHHIAISEFVGRRINKSYRRSYDVIYPPVYTDQFEMSEDKQDFYLAASRMVPYKRFPLIAEAFAMMPDKKLVIIGDGPDFRATEAIATRHDNIRMLGYQPFSVLKDHMQRARAFVFAPLEDFGIIPLEAQACGTPVIAYGKGGATETIIGLDEGDKARPTGLFFHEQSAQAIVDAVNRFEKNLAAFEPQSCRLNAERFSVERFRSEFLSYVEEKSARHFNDLGVEP